MADSIFDSLRTYVLDGAPHLALDELRNYLSGQMGSINECSIREFYNETILQRSRLTRVQRDVRKGLKDYTVADQTTAQVSAGTLELIDDIERRSASQRLPYAQRPVEIDSNAFVLEKVIGANTLKSLAWLHQGLEKAKSVCRIVSPTGLGSGFVMGNGVLITNNHVLENAEQAAESIIEFNFEEDSSGALRKVVSYALNSERFVTNKELDCTAVKIAEGCSDVSLSEWGTLNASSSGNIDIGDHVTIIQHPQGGVKQIGLTENNVVNVFKHRLQYLTDTLPGSSGSPVFNDSWEVIAIHHAGGNLIKNEAGERIFANQGILMSEITQHSVFSSILRTS